jgi:Ca-activated chloride channel homolog
VIPIRRWLHSPRARRGLAASMVVLATGGLVLARSETGRAAVSFGERLEDGSSSFSGPGASGSLSLSHAKVLSSGEQTVFAELRIRADSDRRAAEERAPLAIAIVFDTSGSMSGDKIETSKRSVIELIRQMRSDDEVALVRYSDHSELVQPLAAVGSVRSSLIERVEQFGSGGGTDIPPALERGLRALSAASAGRVKRVILASDGLDSNRSQSERLARNALDSRVTVSALGIGLDFDESYMSGVATAGRGNFAYVRDGQALAGFLSRELDETANTVIDSAHAKLRLPSGVRFVRAVGAEVKSSGRGELALALGSLFAGDERRVIIELGVQAEHGESFPVGAEVDWRLVGGDRASARLAELSMTGERDQREVLRARNGRVYASAISATASWRQLAAAEAYAKGDQDTATALLHENVAQLEAAAEAAPPAAAAPIKRQLGEVAEAKRRFESAAPGSSTGRAAAKITADNNAKNLSRPAF